MNRKPWGLWVRVYNWGRIKLNRFGVSMVEEQCAVCVCVCVCVYVCVCAGGAMTHSTWARDWGLGLGARG